MENENNNINNNKFDWSIPHTRNEIFHAVFNELEEERIKEEKELKTTSKKSHSLHL